MGQIFPYVLPDAGSDRRRCLCGIQITLVVRLAARIASRSLTLLRLAPILPFFMRGGASTTHDPLVANSKSGERHYLNKVFSLSVGNIDHFLCLGKLEHPYESRIPKQYLIKVLFRNVGYLQIYLFMV